MDISVIQLVGIVAGSCTVGGVIVKVFSYVRAKGFREGERNQKLEQVCIATDKPWRGDSFHIITSGKD